MWFKVIASTIFVIALIVKIFCPSITIDNTTIILLILALAPWITQYIKFLEINGIGKVELVGKAEKERIQETADVAGISKNQLEKQSISKYSFYNHRYEDPKLALAGLRIEIESILRKIAIKNSISVNNAGLGKLTDVLSQNQIIGGNERAIIHDMAGILNKAVHSQLDEYDSNSFDWVFDMGIKLLNSLELKCER